VGLSSCTSFGPTKPNDSFNGPYPDNFKQLFYNNKLLAKEIGKLPEIQDGISDIEAKAIELICKLYAEDPDSFDKAFKQMYQVGKPEVRKYCSPLQALYWLALDDKLKQADISDYALTGLLNKAWYMPGFELDGTGRWDDFNDVTERLNSPDLVDYYVSRNFSYKKIRLTSLNDYKNPYNIFKIKQGECWLYTSFCTNCLKKAGYQAHAITVFHNLRKRPSHVTCEYTDKDGKEYILDNTLTARGIGSGIYKKEVYLNIYPYYGKGYLTQ
jgi:hypothetical protein